jgi:hypothetical protein
MTWYTQAARDSLAEVAVINLVNIPVSLGAAYYLAAGALPVFGFIVLLEATVLMFVGGAMDLSMSVGTVALAKLLKQRADKGSDTENEKRRRFQRAVVFVFSGAILFTEAIILTFPYL